MVFLNTGASDQPTMALPLATHFSPIPSSVPAAPAAAAGSTSPIAMLLKADEELRRRAAIALAQAQAQAAAGPWTPAITPAVVAAPPPILAQCPAPLPPKPTPRPVAVKVGPMMMGGTPALGVGVLGALPEGYMPGTMGGHVGMLPGLRPQDKPEYYGELPKKKRASPTDLSGLTDQEKVARRKRHAREYSRQARLRNSHLKTKLADEVDDLSVVRSVFEEAPNVYMVLAGDIRSTTILYANQATEDVLHHAPGTLLGRSFWDVLDEKDRMRVYAAFSELILHRSGVARLRCRIQTSFEDYFLPMDATFSYGTFGIACSLWVPFSEGSH